LKHVNYAGRVGRKVDPDDLVDAVLVAELLGLSTGRSVSTYRRRYSDFPKPIVDMGHGRCLLWSRDDVEKWARAHGRLK
jgi:hypothetical protein